MKCLYHRSDSLLAKSLTVDLDPYNSLRGQAPGTHLTWYASGLVSSEKDSVCKYQNLRKLNWRVISGGIWFKRNTSNPNKQKSQYGCSQQYAWVMKLYLKYVEHWSCSPEEIAMLCPIAKRSPCNLWLKQKIAPCFLCGVTDRAMCCYSGVFCMLGGFPRATIKVTAMNRDVCMESSIAQVTWLWESHPYRYKYQSNSGFG